MVASVSGKAGLQFQCGGLLWATRDEEKVWTWERPQHLPVLGRAPSSHSLTSGCPGLRGHRYIHSPSPLTVFTPSPFRVLSLCLLYKCKY